MADNDIIEKLTSIFRDVFDDEAIVLTAETNSDDIEEWDSLAQISIVVAAQAEFDIAFDISEVTHLKNVGELADLIASKM